MLFCLQSTDSSGSLSGYTTNTRYSGISETDGFRVVDPRGNDDVSRLERKVSHMERSIDELEQRRMSLSDERDSLRKILANKEAELVQKDRELSDLRNSQVSRLI